MIWSYLKQKIPHKPGVYLFKDKAKKIIYVGKAIDLKTRVSSPRNFHWDSVSTIVVESELEALILEANLIKKYLPKFNIRLTDDKDYLYIKITKEDFPKIITARKHDLPAGRQDLQDSVNYFGPFPSSKTVKNTLKALRKVFPWCSGGKKACFYYHLSLCPGACIGEITQKDYRKIIKRFIKFMDGKKDDLVKELTKEMSDLSDMQNFEEANKIKKTLEGIAYLTQTQRVSSYLTNPNFLEDEKNLALYELKKVLNLKNIPERIEGYDISNIQGKEAVGSMVVLSNGEIDKSQYRKFKIHPPVGGLGRPNDVAMMKEMLERRLKHIEWSKPDLIIVDGGLGQVNAVTPIIHNTYYLLPIFGLAKRAEWLYSPEGEIIKLPKASPALKLLQKLRDEAHRFAITYHRKLHDKMLLSS